MLNGSHHPMVEDEVVAPLTASEKAARLDLIAERAEAHNARRRAAASRAESVEADDIDDDTAEAVAVLELAAAPGILDDADESDDGEDETEGVAAIDDELGALDNLPGAIGDMGGR